jgi:flavin-dependent dehydrogenase
LKLRESLKSGPAPNNRTPNEFFLIMAGKPQYDVLVIGGGPAGAIAAFVLAKKGISVLILEKAKFPRFHVGESFLPATFSLMEELGLDSILPDLPHVRKFGAEFGMGGGEESTVFDFDTNFAGRDVNPKTFNIERAPFDQALLNAARDAGAEVRLECNVQKIERLAEDDVHLTTNQGEFQARFLLDASGQGCVTARHLGNRRKIKERHLQKTAYYAHFEKVQRLEGDREGHPMVAMCDEGWFWIIPLNEKITSVGLVLDVQTSRGIDVPPDQMLAWGIARCPLMQHRMKDATGPKINLVVADYTYTCDPFAGPGYFLAGDAATFLDPVFSSGVYLGMSSGKLAAELIGQIMDGKTTAQNARQKYIHIFKKNTNMFFRMIRMFYQHPFRELFLNGQGPLQMHKAVLAVLTGNAMPNPPWAVRWRFELFRLCLKIHSRFGLAPARDHFSLLTPNGTSDPIKSTSVQTSVDSPQSTSTKPH